MELLAAAISHHEELQLDICEESPMSEWTVQLKNGLPEDDLPLDTETVETCDMAEESLSLSDSDDSSELVTPRTLREEMQQADDQLGENLPQCHSRPTTPWIPDDSEGSWDDGDCQNGGWEAGTDWSNAWTSPVETDATSW